jgi:hypothetical protein
MSKPLELPEPDFIDCDGRWYSEEKLRDHGLACRRAGMELAAQVCEELVCFEEDDPGKSAAEAVREAAKGRGERL